MSDIAMTGVREDGRILSGWYRSSYSMSNGQCVETARLADGRVAVRDSKAGPGGPMLLLSPVSWSVFLENVRSVS
jgi:uncharacterized protein DUF397